MFVVKKFLQSLRCIVSNVFTVSNPANVVMVEDDRLRMRKLILARGNELGSGTYGIVTMVKDLRTKRYYAMKVSILNPNIHDREIELLVCLRHPNIVRLHGFYFRDSKKNPSTIIQNMLLECMPGDLFSLFAEQRQRGFRLSDLSIQAYCFQMFRGLAYLHDKKICHRDIKPTNILICRETMKLKISDFGAKENVSQEESTAYMCSRYYRAPELVMGNTKYTESVDVWAAGCVLAECFTCSPIFPGRKDHQLGAICAVLGNPTLNVLRILQPGLRRVRLKRRQPVTLPTALRIPKDHLAILLLESILSYEPSKRLIAWEVCSHPFFEQLLEGDGINLKFDFTQSEVNHMPQRVRESLLTRKQCSQEVEWHSVMEGDTMQMKRKKASTVVQLVRTQALRRAASTQSSREKTQSVSDAPTMTTLDKDNSPTVFEERRSHDLESFSSILQLSRAEFGKQVCLPYEMETPSSTASTEYGDKEEEDDSERQPKDGRVRSGSKFMCILKTPFDGTTESSSDVDKSRKEEQLGGNYPDGSVLPLNPNCRVISQLTSEGSLNESEKKSDRQK